MNTPKLWTRLLKWFCHEGYFEELQGDIEEQYQMKLEKEGKTKANAYYRKEVLLLIRPSVINYIPLKRYVNWAFVKHSFKASFRNLKKHRAYTALNVVGFAAALSICLFCVNAIYSNQALDQKFPDRELVYRVNTSVFERGNNSIYAKSPIPLYEKIQENIPEVEKIAILQNGAFGFEAFLNGANRQLQVSSVNEDFFDIFTYDVIAGDIYSIFNNKSYVIVTKELVDKYFDLKTIIGTTLGPYIVGGVIETPSKVSHLKFDILANDLKDKSAIPFYSSWQSYYLQQLYIKKYPNTEEKTIQDKLQGISKEVNEELKDTENAPVFDYRLEALKDVASSDVSLNQGDLLGNGGQKIILTLMLVLLGVCTFNYTNLAMASIYSRTKEVAIRKVMGGSKVALILQLLAETLLLTGFSFLIGLFLFKWLAPKFASFSQFYFQTDLGLKQLLIFALFTILAAIVSGLIPGIIFSNVSILQLFKKTKSKGRFSLKHLKKTMVIIQMTISLFVFIVGFFLYNQASLIQNQENALVKENFIGIQLPKTDSTNVVFKNELLKINGIESVIPISGLPLLQRMGVWSFKKQHNQEQLRGGVYVIHADTSIINLLGDGVRWFGNKPKEFTQPFFLANDLLVEEASDSIMDISSGFYSLGNEEFSPVLGTVENLFGNDLAIEPEPAAVMVTPNINSASLYIQLAPGSTAPAISKIQDLYQSQYPEAYFQPYFLTDMLAQNLSPFRNAVKAILFVLTAIIVITLMGQIGMSMYMAKTKEKEIGIRKVLGASFRQVVNLILRSTYLQLLIGTLIACPLAYLFYINIIPSFTIPLKIGIEHFVIGVATFSVIIIALIMAQTWGTTNAEPAETLRSE